ANLLPKAAADANGLPRSFTRKVSTLSAISLLGMPSRAARGLGMIAIESTLPVVRSVLCGRQVSFPFLFVLLPDQVSVVPASGNIQKKLQRQSCDGAKSMTLPILCDLGLQPPHVAD